MSPNSVEPLAGVSLRPYTTLRAGGCAEHFAFAHTVDELHDAVAYSFERDIRLTLLGSGSNVLPSDDGVPGLTVLNRCARITIQPDGTVEAETGCGFQELFLRCAQAGLGGLEFAVGIPGTLGGALVSNAGAYRSCVAEFITEMEVSVDSERHWSPPSFMQFAYRNSILRRTDPPRCAVLRVRFKLPERAPKEIYDEARGYQRQRISKQPPPASAGSFFKNVERAALADSLEGLPEPLKAAGAVPAGFLLERTGVAGLRHGGAMFSSRHANFLLNVGRATATELRTLAEIARRRVLDTYGVTLEEEVLYLGDWSRFKSTLG